jgi:hypothetical protein
MFRAIWGKQFEKGTRKVKKLSKRIKSEKKETEKKEVESKEESRK